MIAMRKDSRFKRLDEGDAMIKKGKSKRAQVSEIQPYENNPVIHSEAQIERVRRSIEKVGYRARIGVDANNVIVYGHARHAALLQIDPTMVIPVDDMSDLSEKEIAEYRIKDNSLRSTDIDEKALYKELEELHDDLDANIDAIREEMNIDVKRLAKKIGAEAGGIPAPARSSSVRVSQIILEYEQNDYERVQLMAANLCEKMGITSKSDLFLKLLENDS